MSTWLVLSLEVCDDLYVLRCSAGFLLSLGGPTVNLPFRCDYSEGRKWTW